MTDNEIFKRADEYAGHLYNELSLHPVCGVEPQITSNAQRIGYVAGARMMRAYYEPKIEETRKEARIWKSVSAAAFFVLIILSAVLLMTV